MNLFNKVVSSPSDYNFEIENLGDCKIPSPIRNPVFIKPGSRALLTNNSAILTKNIETGCSPASFEIAGPHRSIFHDPAWSRAAILTAGGLCPGLNHVIKGIVEILEFDYGIKTIYGIPYGYRGLAARHSLTPIMLDTEVVDTIHTNGGTILGSSRGQQDTPEMVDTLTRMNINLLFCIGGDGSLRAARDLADECRRRNLSISIVGIPKTIDNDLHFVGRSFGFESAVTATSPVIEAAHMEAKGSINGIGLIKLMGRDSGFIATYATLANPVVNFCLVPEEPFPMDGPNGLLKALERRFREKSHAVLVIAEGAGQDLVAGEEDRYDLSGNLLKRDIGEYLRRRISEHFEQLSIETNIKYFDPSYSIRSIPAVGADAIRCYMLARSAVHAAMAGRTNCVVGNLHTGNTYTLVPIDLAADERQKVDLNGDLWRAVLDATDQRDYFNTNGQSTSASP